MLARIPQPPQPPENGHANMAIRIPKEDYDRVATLFAMSQADLDSLSIALTEAAPSLRLSKFSRNVQERVSLDPSVVDDVVRLLVAICSVQSQESLDATQVVDAICDAAPLTKDERLKAPSVGWGVLKSYLVSFLKLEKSLGVTAKAAFVAYQYPYHLHDARIITDARPVFPRNAGDGPTAYMIIHSLALEVHEGDQDHRWFVALDSTDLERLRDTIDRALLKEQTLQNSLQRTGTPVLAWKDATDAASS